MTTFISFVRRHNADSTVDSICTRCYQTIGHDEMETALTEAEQSHFCSPTCEYLLLHPQEQIARI